MRRVEAFFHEGIAPVRPYLLARLVLVMLALDAWLLMAGHGARYGLIDFNVAHFGWLDAVQPVPSAAWYVAVLLGSGMLAVVIAATGGSLWSRAALLVMYTYSWAMSMLDSYQHHYFLSIVLLCVVFVPHVSSGELLEGAREPRTRQDGAQPLCHAWSYALLGASIAIVYLYTTIAKLDADWRSGDTLRHLNAGEQGLGWLLPFAARLGITESDLWSWLALGVIPLEALIALLYLVAVPQDARPSRWRRAASWLGWLSAMALHVGAEAQGLRIGWFSYYMIALACIFFLPPGWLHAAALLVARPACWIARHLLEEGAAKPRPAPALAMAVAVAVVLGVVGQLVDLPGATAAGGTAGAVLVLSSAVLSWRGDTKKARELGMATAAAGALMWLAIAASDVRWDYYRFLGGDLRRRNHPEAALRAYLKAERYAPEDETRQDRIEQLRRRLGRTR